MWYEQLIKDVFIYRDYEIRDGSMFVCQTELITNKECFLGPRIII